MYKIGFFGISPESGCTTNALNVARFIVESGYPAAVIEPASNPHKTLQEYLPKPETQGKKKKKGQQETTDIAAPVERDGVYLCPQWEEGLYPLPDTEFQLWDYGAEYKHLYDEDIDLVILSSGPDGYMRISALSKSEDWEPLKKKSYMFLAKCPQTTSDEFREIMLRSYRISYSKLSCPTQLSSVIANEMERKGYVLQTVEELMGEWDAVPEKNSESLKKSESKPSVKTDEYGFPIPEDTSLLSSLIEKDLFKGSGGKEKKEKVKAPKPEKEEKLPSDKKKGGLFASLFGKKDKSSTTSDEIKARRDEENARKQAEAEEKKRLAEEEAARRKEEQAAEAKRKAEEKEEARRKAEEQAALELEEKERKAAEEKQRKEEERRAETERKQAEAEAKKKADEERKRRQEEEAEAKRLAEEERKRIAAEEAARKKAEEDERKRLEAEEKARKKAEQERLKAEAEEEERRRKAEEKARKEEEKAAKKAAREEEIARIKAESEERQRKAQEEKEAEEKRRAELLEEKRQEEELRRIEEDARRAAEEAEKAAEEERRKTEEALRKAEEDAERAAREAEEARKEAEQRELDEQTKANIVRTDEELKRLREEKAARDKALKERQRLESQEKKKTDELRRQLAQETEALEKAKLEKARIDASLEANKKNAEILQQQRKEIANARLELFGEIGEAKQENEDILRSNPELLAPAETQGKKGFLKSLFGKMTGVPATITESTSLVPAQQPIDSKTMKKASFVGHLSVFVTSLEHSASATHTASGIAAAFAKTGMKSCICHPAGTPFPQSPLITEDTSGNDEAYISSRAIIYDRGTIIELTPDEKKELRRSDVKVMCCKGEESGISALARFIHKEGEEKSHEWLYVFNTLSKKRLKMVKGIMLDYDVLYLDAFDIDDIEPLTVKQIIEAITSKSAEIGKKK